MTSRAEGASAEEADAADGKDRKKARLLVNEALRAAGTPLDNRCLRHRLLPGLWQASMNVVINCLEPDDVVRLLTDRARGILGEGTNADSPPRSIPERSMPAYIAEVEAAARTLMERFEEALERLSEVSLEDNFPESVLDVGLQVLIPAWGPAHVRRALHEQCALMIRGEEQPSNFMEPTRLNDPAPKRRPQEEMAADVPAHAPVPQPQPGTPPAALPEPPRRERVPRRVTAYATHDVSPSGTAAWAVALVMHDDSGRTERREIGGTLTDANGRAASLLALRECVTAACEGASRAVVTVETPSEQCVRAAADGGLPGARLVGEEQVWESVDAAAAIHQVEFKLARTSLDRDLSERCDRLVRSLLDS